nr:ferredoxin family protein [Rhodococcus sp. 2G]
MIEVIVAERCISCDICIAVCPTDVFERAPDGLPVVAHQEDCQTCFMCEVNCPADAL